MFKELSVEIPVIGYENLPLKEVEHSLRCMLKHFRKVKEQRVAEFMVLRKRVRYLLYVLIVIHS